LPLPPVIKAVSKLIYIIPSLVDSIFQLYCD
jgi:hypothetical protein